MVRLAQLVRASDCGSEGQGFETLISPQNKRGNPQGFPLLFSHSPHTHTPSTIAGSMLSCLLIFLPTLIVGSLFPDKKSQMREGLTPSNLAREA